MIRTSRQLKALVRNMSKGDSIKAQIIIRNYVMERFLERLSLSGYRDNLIVKGGILVSAIVGLDDRSTMDIDATFKNLPLSEESARKVVEDIAGIRIDDGMAFEIKSVSSIMDEADYPGFRVILDAMLETMRTPFKIDFSSGDIITPCEVTHLFKLLFEERSISILAYNLETILAEKLETLLARGTANSRMRDFYDIFALENTQSHNIDAEVLKAAFTNTSNNRGSTAVIESMDLVLDEIERSSDMMALWKNYQRKFGYSAGISWDKIMQTIKNYAMLLKN